jgi:putative membrane protein
MKTIIHWVILTIAIIITAYILPGVHVTGLLAAGLFTLIINAALVELAARIVPGFTIASFWWALLFAVVLSVVNWTLHKFEKKDK